MPLVLTSFNQHIYNNSIGTSRHASVPPPTARSAPSLSAHCKSLGEKEDVEHAPTHQVSDEQRRQEGGNRSTHAHWSWQAESHRVDQALTLWTLEEKDENKNKMCVDWDENYSTSSTPSSAINYSIVRAQSNKINPWRESTV